jgi:hypothetical protein
MQSVMMMQVLEPLNVRVRLRAYPLPSSRYCESRLNRLVIDKCPSLCCRNVCSWKVCLGYYSGVATLSLIKLRH